MADNERTTYTVKVIRDEDEALFAEVLQLPGCFASGDDLPELFEALGEAISLYLSTEDVAVTVELRNPERILTVIDGGGESEFPAEVDFALAK